MFINWLSSVLSSTKQSIYIHHESGSGTKDCRETRAVDLRSEPSPAEQRNKCHLQNNNSHHTEAPMETNIRRRSFSGQIKLLKYISTLSRKQLLVFALWMKWIDDAVKN